MKFNFHLTEFYIFILVKLFVSLIFYCYFCKTVFDVCIGYFWSYYCYLFFPFNFIPIIWLDAWIQWVVFLLFFICFILYCFILFMKAVLFFICFCLWILSVYFSECELCLVNIHLKLFEFLFYGFESYLCLLASFCSHFMPGYGFLVFSFTCLVMFVKLTCLVMLCKRFSFEWCNSIFFFLMIIN